MQGGTLDLMALAKELVRGMPALGETEQRVAVALYQLLAEGQPVSSARLAEHLGLPASRVAAILKAWPGVFFNDEGSVVAFWGLAQPKMSHRFEVNGHQLHTWCAWDSLFLPQIIGREAHVESICPTTGEAVSLTVGPAVVQTASPQRPVLSFLRPQTGFDENVIQSFCHYVLFFASEDAGRRWTSEHNDTFLLSIQEGFELGRLWIEDAFGTALAPSRRGATR